MAFLAEIMGVTFGVGKKMSVFREFYLFSNKSVLENAFLRRF